MYSASTRSRAGTSVGDGDCPRLGTAGRRTGGWEPGGGGLTAARRAALRAGSGARLAGHGASPRRTNTKFRFLKRLLRALQSRIAQQRRAADAAPPGALARAVPARAGESGREAAGGRRGERGVGWRGGRGGRWAGAGSAAKDLAAGAPSTRREGLLNVRRGAMRLKGKKRAVRALAQQVQTLSTFGRFVSISFFFSRFFGSQLFAPDGHSVREAFCCGFRRLKMPLQMKCAHRPGREAGRRLRWARTRGAQTERRMNGRAELTSRGGAGVWTIRLSGAAR